MGSEDDKDKRDAGDDEADEKVDQVEEQEVDRVDELDEANAHDQAKANAEAASAPAAARKKKRKKRPADEQPPADEPVLVARDVIAAPPSRRNTMIIVAVLVFAALGLAGYLLARDRGDAAWAVGQQVDVEITIVAGDAKNLACAALDEVEGRHCAFEAVDKPWSKSKEQSDEKTLRPYTTLDKHQLAAAGLWSQPALQGKLPSGRFTVACKFKVEGKLVKPMVRWSSSGPFSEGGPSWPAGSLSDCKIADAPDAGG